MDRMGFAAFDGPGFRLPGLSACGLVPAPVSAAHTALKMLCISRAGPPNLCNCRIAASIQAER
jgi:hypothetical protein